MFTIFHLLAAKFLTGFFVTFTTAYAGFLVSKAGGQAPPGYDLPTIVWNSIIWPWIVVTAINTIIVLSLMKEKDDDVGP